MTISLRVRLDASKKDGNGKMRAPHHMGSPFQCPISIHPNRIRKEKELQILFFCLVQIGNSWLKRGWKEGEREERKKNEKLRELYKG